eukprot:4913433-Pyramimonas_sp.AAC.2
MDEQSSHELMKNYFTEGKTICDKHVLAAAAEKARVFALVPRWVTLAAPVASPGVDCRPANGSPPAGNIRRIFHGIFEMPCDEWCTSVDSRLLN